jgi:hypothetical protein
MMIMFMMMTRIRQVYDPEETGYISPEVLKEIFHDLDLAKLTDDDLQ